VAWPVWWLEAWTKYVHGGPPAHSHGAAADTGPVDGSGPTRGDVGVIDHSRETVELTERMGRVGRIVAERPEDEREMRRSLLDYLRSLPGDPAIDPYPTFEATHLRRLAERHGLDPASEAGLFGGLVDLHGALKDSVVLPVHSYGLKRVA